MKINFLIILCLVMIAGCRQPFIPPMDDYESSLVVDGMISNEPGPYTINLSKSQPLDQDSLIPYPGCRVTILENSGNSEVLTEVGEGIYQTSSGGIQGEVGHAYRITIETPGGDSYETDYVKIRQPVEIDTVYGEADNPKFNAWPEGLPGIRFYIDTRPADEDSTFFLWKLIETYEYTADFMISVVYQDYRFQPFPSDSLYRCWHTRPIREIHVSQTSGLSEPKLSRHPLHFVGTDNKKLTNRYSLLVKQYTIDKRAYEFWNRIEEQIAGEHFFFARQPYQIKGNVYNPDKPDELVRGYFTVGSVSTMRIFMDKPFSEFNFPMCSLNFDLRYINIEPPESWPIFLKWQDGNLGKASKKCFDCRLSGGKLTPPEFWKD